MNTSEDQITIRHVTLEDFPKVLEMINTFAAFQRTPEKVSITLEQMQKDKDIFECLLLSSNEEIIGFATYYFAYSSWSGKSLYLDDIYIEEAQRGKSLGRMFMDELEKIAKQNACTKMRWLVSKWNEPAIEFYKKRGATIYDTEFTCEQDLKS